MPEKKAPSTRRRPKLLCMADVKPSQIRWLWYPYIPAGRLTMLYGKGGIGKSFITCDIAAKVTTGRILPGQTKGLGGQKVLMINAEDDPSDVLVHRLQSSGADLTRVMVPDEFFTLDEVGIRHLRRLMKEMAATLVFVDPVVAAMGGARDMMKANEVRSLLQPLHVAAQESGSAVVVVHHVRKSQEGASDAFAAGSYDFINGVRSALYVESEGDETGAMHHVKANLSRKGQSLRFKFMENPDGSSYIEWTEAFDPRPQITKRPRGAARAFLTSILADGPVASKEIEARAADEGINERTLKRAKSEMGIESERRDGIWFWKLP